MWVEKAYSNDIMHMKREIEQLLEGIKHPETGEGIVGSGIAEVTLADAGSVAVNLRFAKARDPFAQKIRRQVEEKLAGRYPGAEVRVTVVEAAPKKTPAERPSTTGRLAYTVVVPSGKGVVG